MNNRPNTVTGVGLFGATSPPLFKNVENKIISYFAITDILNCITLNKNPWYRRMREEVRKRKKCVTVYTWLSAEASSDRFKGLLGHSALRTYTGAENNEGIYVSFYPGNCDTSNRHPTCHKNISHFHTWNQEDRSQATSFDLYGLDVDKINSAYHKMYHLDEKQYMNSVKQWEVTYNCSDVVLNLLEAGGLYNKVDLRRYGRKAILIISFIMMVLAPSAVRGMFSSSRLEENILTAIGVNESSSWHTRCYLFARDLIDGLAGGIFSTAAAFVYSKLSFLKSYLPLPYTNNLTNNDAIAAGIISFCTPFLLTEARILLISKGIASGFFLDQVYHKFVLSVIKYCPSSIFSWLSDIDTPYLSQIFNILALGLTASSVAISVCPRFIYDTSTTPEHVLNLINQADKPQLNTQIAKQHFRFFCLHNNNSGSSITIRPHQDYKFHI